MIVPQYWAEGRAQGMQGKRQVTIRRFGWSDTSTAEAQKMADARSREALQQFLSGVRLLRSEPKIPYNGADGVPIREEVVERHGESVVTRNSYGARCLNTPNVLFADIDFQSPRTGGIIGGMVLLMAIPALIVGWHFQSTPVWIILALGILIASRISANKAMRTARAKADSAETVARDRIRATVAARPGWAARVYRTPAGLRVLVTHRLFEPSDPAVTEFFDALRVDPLFARMCLKQQCFRARVSPKPWRIGIQDHMRPRPGIWPVSPERMGLRQSWVDRYEAVAAAFAACAFIESVGSESIHSNVAPVQKLHDDLCKATAGLPIA